MAPKLALPNSGVPFQLLLRLLLGFVLHLFSLWHSDQDLERLLQIPLSLHQRLLRDRFANFEFGHLHNTVVL